jgi:L-asparaginase II
VQFARVRSGLAESFEDVDAVAIDADGSVLFVSGDAELPMYYRSSMKPFQALAARRAGLDLPPEHLAVSCASHGGFPVHIAIVRSILADAGLNTSDLGCATDRPLDSVADRILAASGHTVRESVLHNCSGKHAGWLAACVTAGWDTKSYLDTDHPLQRSIVDVLHEYSKVDPEPVGVDGCGAPTLRGTITGLATAFQRLGSDPEIARIASAMARFGPLVTDNMRPSGRISLQWGGPVKSGAEGSIALARQGVGIAAKSRTGNQTAAAAAALEVADRLGMLTEAMNTALEDVRTPKVVGGGRPVGSWKLLQV